MFLFKPVRFAILLMAIIVMQCSGKTYSTLFQPFDLVFGSKANSAVSVSLASATPLSPTRVRVTFTKPISLLAAENTANYVITDAAGNRIDVIAATRDPFDSSVIYIDTSLHTTGTQYTITATNLTGVDGSSLGSNAASYTAPNNVDAAAPAISAANMSSTSKLHITFSEAVDQATAQTSGNYTFYTNATCSTGFTTTISNLTRDTLNFAKVSMDLTGPSPTGGTAYYVRVDGVKDIWGNAMSNVCSAAWPGFGAAVAPRVSSAVAQSPTSILVTFDSAMTITGASLTQLQTRTNYTFSQCAGANLATSVSTTATVLNSTQVVVSTLTNAGVANGTCKLTVNAGTGILGSNGAALSASANTAYFPYSTSDSTPPVVGSVSAVNAVTVRVTFNEPIDNTTAVASNFSFSPALTAGAVTCQTGAGNYTYCDVTTSAQTTQAYSVTVSGIKDVAGNTISTAATSFTGDGKPYITGIIPIDAFSVRVQWSEPITATGNDIVDYLVNGATVDTVSVFPSGATTSDTFTFTLATAMTSGTTYTLTYADAGTLTADTTGNNPVSPMTIPSSGVFTGPAFTSAPQVTSANSPSATTVRVIFNEALDNSPATSMLNTNFTISGIGCPNGGANISSVSQVQSGVVQLVLTLPSTTSQTCTVIAGTGVKNIYGNSVVADGVNDRATFLYTGSATTDTTAPSVLSAIALSGTQVKIFFSEAVVTTGGAGGANSATNPANYTFSPSLTVGSVTCSGSSCTLNVTGQSSSTYTVTAANLQDTTGNTMTSASATFYGTGGSNAAPTLYLASLISPTVVELSFSEQMDLARAQNSAMYAITTSATAQSVTAAVRQADATKVRLTLSPGAFGASNSYTVTGNNSASLTVTTPLTDIAANILGATNSATFTGSANAPSTAPDLAPSSDTGSSNTDNVTGFGITFPSPGLVFTGTVAPNTVVVIYDNGTLVGSATSDSSGSYSVAATATPAPGSYTIATVSSTGVVSDPSPAISITFDNAASAAPGTPVLKATSNTGISSADAFTNATTPTFTVTCVGTESVQLYDGTTATGAAASCSAGSVDLTTGTLTGGTGTSYASINAKQTDAAGNTSPASGNATTFTIDTSAATISTSTVDSVSNRYIQLDFSDPVYGSATAATGVTLNSAFTINTTGGVATAAINCITTTASTSCPGTAPSGGETSIRVQLTITGTPNGSELTTITTAANAVFDRAGNASSTNTGGKALVAAGIASITGGSYTAVGTAGSTTGYVTVSFANAAYTNAGPAGALVAGDFTAALGTTGNATTVSVACVTDTASGSCPGTAPAAGATSVRVFLTFNNPPSGAETVQVNAAANEIYGAGGATPATSNTGALAVTDRLAPVISSVSPATNAFITSTLVSYTNSEDCSAGAGSRVTWTRTGGTADGGSPHQVNLAGSELTAATHTNITLTNTQALVSGTVYTVDFTCTDAAGNAATTVSSSNVTYDTTAPTVSSVTSSTANGTYGIGSTVSIQVVFSETVTVTGTPQLTLETGTTDAVVNYVSGSGSTTLNFTYTVASGETSGDLAYQSTGALALNSGTIRDAASNNATLTLPALGGGTSLDGSKAIVIDTTAPTVTGVSSSTANGSYKSGQTVNIDITFSEAVTFTGTPQITLETGTTDAVVNCSAGGPATTHTCVYTIAAGHTSADLDYLSTTALALNGGTINDAASNAATLTLATPGATNSLAANKAIVIDTTAPTVTGVSSSTADGTYGTNAVISIQVTFSEAVTVSGTPQLTLSTGTPSTTAINYVSGSGTNILSFDYTVASGNVSSDLDYALNTSLTAGTSIRDAALNDATLTLPNPGASGSLAANKAIVIAANVTFSITSAETMDCDPVDGIIDHYKITFGAAARDNTFDGYIANAEGLATTKWAISGRSSVRLHHGTALPAACGTDTANDTVIYVKFNQGASVDTASTPDITGTNDTLAANSDGVTKLFSNTGNWVTTDVTESDKAGPFIYLATAGTSGAGGAGVDANDTLVLKFSERTNAAALTGIGLDTIFTLNNSHSFGVAANISSANWTSGTFTNDTLTITFANTTPTVAVGDTIKLTPQVTLTDNVTNQSAAVANVTSPATIGGTFAPGQVGPAISSATYLDTDANGYIDTVRVIFDKTVQDSSFPGYVLNSTGTVTTQWSVSGYNNVKLIHGTAVTWTTDTANDSTIYLRFSEGSSYDTGSKPDLTATDQSLYGPAGGSLGTTACYINTSVGASSCNTQTSSDVGTASVVEADAALPIIVKATAKVGSTSIFISFSENVWTTTGSPACGSGGALVTADFSYVDGNATAPNGVASIGGVSGDSCASADAFIEAVGNANYASGDLNVDKIRSATATSIYDGADNGMAIARQQVIAEATAPYVLSASTYYSTSLAKYYVRIFFSEAVSNAAATNSYSAFRTANYTIAESPSDSGCADFSATPSNIVAVGGSNRVFDLETGAQCSSTIYLVTASTSIKDIDEFENVTTPNFAYATGTASTDITKPKLLLARSLSATTVELTYSEPMKSGDVTGSTECKSTFTTAASCSADIDGTAGTQVKYTITPTGGSLTSVTSVVATADASVFTLTHGGAQSGNFYTVNAYASNTVANIPEDLAGNDLTGSPGNQTVFQGAGTPILTFSDGPVFNDPFSDGTKFNFAFTYSNKVYLGPNDKNSAAFRFEADGLNPLGVTFATTLSSGGASCGSPFTYTSFGITSGTCGAQTIGPYSERGLVGLNSGTYDNGTNQVELLMAGVIKDNVDRMYFTQDVDTQLDWTACTNTFTGTNGINSKSVQSLYIFGTNIYAGIASAHNTNSPVLNKIPLTYNSGTISCTGAFTDLSGNNIVNIGKQNGNGAPNGTTVGIDSQIYIPSTGGPTPTNTYYLFNNGGIAYSTGAPTSNTSFTSAKTEASFSGTALTYPAATGLEKVRPGQKGMPLVVVWNGALYAARNLASGTSAANREINAGAELWKCKASCTTAANWKKVLSTTDTGNTFANRANLRSISLLQVNGSYLYIGLDNATNGAQIYRSQSGITEIDGTTACTSGDTTADNGDGYRCFQQQGTAGFGAPSENQFFFSSASLRKGSSNYIYVTVGDQNLVAIKVLRQVD